MKKVFFSIPVTKRGLIVFSVAFFLLAVWVGRWAIGKIGFYFREIRLCTISEQAPKPVMVNSLKRMEESGISYELRESEERGAGELDVYVSGWDIEKAQDIMNEQWLLLNEQAGKPAPVLTYDFEKRPQPD